MLKWLVNDVDKIQLVFYGVILLTCLMCALIINAQAKETERPPCSEYADIQVKGLPARCLGYWIEYRENGKDK